MRLTLNKQSIILCDFDGTLIEGDLERAFMRYLLKKKEIKYKMLLVSLFTLPINFLRNTFGFPSILKSWTFVLKDSTNQYISNFIHDCGSKIQSKQQGWNLLNSLKDSKRVLLTGCYDKLIRAYLKYCNLDTVFDEIIACEMKNNLIVRRHPFGRGKVPFVPVHAYTIGIANEYSDHYYMDLCSEKYYIK